MKYLKIYCTFSFFLLFVYNSSAQFADTTVNVIRCWNNDLYSGLQQNTDFDTNVFVVSRYNPLIKKSYSNIRLVNLGSAALSAIYNDRLNNSFVFANGFTPYLFDVNSFKIYKSKIPFTLASFVIGDMNDNETRTLDLLHTQNVNRYTNVGFALRSIQSAGELSAGNETQSTSLNNISLFGSYDKEKLKIYTAINRNMFKSKENGGIVDSMTNNEERVNWDTQFENVLFISNANSKFRNLNYQLLSEYKLVNFRKKSVNDTIDPELSKTSIIIGQLTNFEQYYRTFTAEIGNDSILRFVPQINSKNFNDSAFYRTLQNRVYFKLKSGNQSITGGIENEFLKYAHKIIPDTTFHFIEGENGTTTIFEESEIKTFKNNIEFKTALFGDLEINVSNLLNLKFIGKLYFLGYQQGTIDLSGRAGLNFKKAQIFLSSELKTSKPDYFYQNYISNIYSWHNDFENTRELKTQVLIMHKEKSTGIKLNYDIISNLLYFNLNALPEQLNEITSVISIKLFGEFDLWKFRTRNELTIQRTGNENVLPLPALTLFHSFCFNQKLFKDVLHFNLGYDLYYNTSYYSYAYEPITGIFYNQNERKTGSFPFLDIYLNFKVKKTLFFIKYENITDKILTDEVYYSLLHYPYAGGALHIGIRWIFLN